MKNKKPFITTSVAFSFIAATCFTIYSCKKDPLAGVDLITNINFTSATIGAQFVDANTGESITESITVKLVGANAADIIDVAEGTNFTPKDGLLAMAVREGVTPSLTNPVEFTIVASASGYVTTSVPVVITEEGGIGVSVNMVSIADAPAGVAVAVNTTSLTVAEASSPTGTITAIAIATPASTSGSDLSVTKIDIPVGEKFYADAAHTQRITEAIETTIARFSATENASLAAFPGSLQANFSDGTQGIFKSAGLVSIEMKGATTGTEVKFFETPIQVSVGMPASLKNDNGVTVSVGDVVPIWSHDNATGKWTNEGTAVVAAGIGPNAGNLQVDFPVTHLSSWNVDWWGNSCDLGAKVTITGDITVATSLYYSIYRASDNSYITGHSGSFKAGNTIQLSYSGDFNIIMKVYKTFMDEILEQNAIATSDPFNGCSGTPTLIVNLGNVTPINVTVNTTCASKPGVVFRPEFPIWYQEVGVHAANQWEFLGNMVDGKISSSKVFMGHTYNFKINYDGATYVKGPYTIDQTDYFFQQEMDPSSCSKLQ